MQFFFVMGLEIIIFQWFVFAFSGPVYKGKTEALGHLNTNICQVMAELYEKVIERIILLILFFIINKIRIIFLIFNVRKFELD